MEDFEDFGDVGDVEDVEDLKDLKDLKDVDELADILAYGTCPHRTPTIGFLFFTDGLSRRRTGELSRRRTGGLWRCAAHDSNEHCGHKRLP